MNILTYGCFAGYGNTTGEAAPFEPLQLIILMMKKIFHYITLVVLVIWLVGIPVFSLTPEYAQAETVEKNSSKIGGVTPASGSITNIARPNVSASFGLAAGETYAAATVEVDGSNDTTNAGPSATGFSYNPDLGQGNHQVKTTLFYDTSSGMDYAIRVWSYTVDTVNPATGVQPMPDYTSNYKIMVPVKGSDSVTGIASTELWYKFDNDGNTFNDPWQLGPVVARMPESVFFDAGQRGGEGRFAFMTIATDNAGNKEVKSFHEEAWIIYDDTAPRQLSRDRIVLEQKASGNQDSIYCLPGSVDDTSTKVVAYSDSALKQIIFESPVYGENGQKKCGAYGIGDNQYATIYVVAYDSAGNASFATQVDNNFLIASAPLNLNAKRVSDSSVLLTWNSPVGEAGFRIRYRQVGETTFSDFVELQSNLNSATITGLNPLASYEFSVTTKDLHGDESLASMVTFPTKTQAVASTQATPVATTQPTDKTTEKTTEKTDTTKPTDKSDTKKEETTKKDESKDTTKDESATKDETKDTTKVDNTTSTDDNKVGEVKGTESKDSETSRNWTPWIVLAILIILAGAATGGYFYWFGGPEEITTTVKSEEPKKGTDEKSDDKDQEARW